MFLKMILFPFQLACIILFVGWMMTGWIVLPMIASHYLGGWGLVVGLGTWWVGVALVFHFLMEG